MYMSVFISIILLLELTEIKSTHFIIINDVK